jgi:CRISPR-associated protein Csb1
MPVELAELGTARAARAIIALEPVDGPGGRIFPMTVKGGQHVIEDGPDGRRVLIDSCASQANRQEAALLVARQAGQIELADIVVDLIGTQAGREGISTLEMPHRIADAILHDSEIDDAIFVESTVGRRVLGATPRDLTAILEVAPASLVFGAWFSRPGLGGLKIERASVGEIWGHGAQIGKSVGSRIDPLGLVDIYQARDGIWTADEAEAVTDSKGNRVRYTPKKNAKGKTTELGHSNIPPTVVERGVICERYELRWSLSGAALRRQSFGGPGERDEAARRYLMALGLVARVLAHEDGYHLRSRCHLLAKGPLTVEMIGRDGEVLEHQVGVEAAVLLLRRAQAGLVAAGFAPPQTIKAKPSRRLRGLIARSREAVPEEDAA